MDENRLKDLLDKLRQSNASVRPDAFARPQAASVNLEESVEQVEPESEPAALPAPKIAPETEVNPLLVTAPTAGTVDELERLQRLANLNRMGAGIEKSSAKIRDALLRVPKSEQDYSDYDRRIKEADLPIIQYQQRVQQEKIDPKSAYSEGMRKFAKNLGVNLEGNVSGETIEKLMPVIARQYDANQSRMFQQDQLQLRLAERKFEAEQRAKDRAQLEGLKREERDLARSEKKQLQSRLSDKQVESINEYDDSLNKMQAALDSLGKNTGWVGPSDGRIPDVLVSDEQVAFRSAVGRMQDAYRKLITGAGASNLELQRLESRLPKPTDTYSNFQAKAKAFIKEIEKAKQQRLTNYAKQGKDVSGFTAEESESESKQLQPTPSSGKIKVMSPEGKIGLIPAANLDAALKRGFKEVK